MSAFGGKADIGEQMWKQATVHSRLENDSGFVPSAASRRLVRRGVRNHQSGKFGSASTGRYCIVRIRPCFLQVWEPAVVFPEPCLECLVKQRIWAGTFFNLAAAWCRRDGPVSS